MSKDEVRVFILRAVKEGIFCDFFCLQEQKEQEAVDALFEEIFLDAFLSCDQDQIDRQCYTKVVQDKLHDDSQLKSLLIREFDHVDKEREQRVNEKQVKKALHHILRKQINKLADMDSDDDTMLVGQ